MKAGLILRRFITPLLALGLLALTGCASVLNGTQQSVSVYAHQGNDNVNAHCVLSNNKGTWEVDTPAVIKIHRSYQDLTVACNKDGLEPGSIIVPSHAKAAAFGNILVGGVIGAAVDAGNGSAYDYPDALQVLMGVNAPKPVVIADNPDFEQKHAFAPLDGSVELSPRHSAHGQTVRLGRHGQWNRFCHMSEIPTIDVPTPPAHGKLEIRQERFEISSASECAGSTVDGTVVYFTPEAGFHGEEKVSYNVVTKNGSRPVTANIAID